MISFDGWSSDSDGMGLERSDKFSWDEQARSGGESVGALEAWRTERENDVEVSGELLGISFIERGSLVVEVESKFGT